MGRRSDNTREELYRMILDATIQLIEKDGLQVFISTGCTACHSGNVLGGNIYQKFGLFDDYWKHTKSTVIDDGKFSVTKNESDKYVFKSPSLRNIEKTLFHPKNVVVVRQPGPFRPFSRSSPSQTLRRPVRRC